jgi:hypothetical protein
VKIETNPQRQIKVEAVMVLLRSLKAGEILENTAIKDQLGIDPQDRDNGGYSICYDARERLTRKEGLTFRVETNVGIRRLPDDENVLDDIRRKRMRGQTKRRAKELAGIDYASLDPELQHTLTVETLRNRLLDNTLRDRPRLPDSRAPSAIESDVTNALRKTLKKSCKTFEELMMSNAEPELLFALLTGRTPGSLCCTEHDIEVLRNFITDGPKTPKQMHICLETFVEEDES